MEIYSTMCIALFFLIVVIGPISCQLSESRDVVEGQSIRLQCRFPPVPSARDVTYFWYQKRGYETEVTAVNGKGIGVNYHVDLAPQEGRYDLVISRAQYDSDNGIYECKLKDGVTSESIFTMAFEVTVLIPPGPPQITPPKPVAREGETFALSCMSEGGSPDPLIQWYRDDVPLQAQLQKGGSRDRPTTSVLSISPRMEDDNATYRCVVWNRAIREEMRMDSAVVLRVQYAPRLTVGPYNPLKIMTNNDASLTCFFHANPPVRSIKWTKAGQLLSHTANHTIPSVKPSDSGIYTCSADNGIGDGAQVNLELAVIYGPTVNLIPEKEVSLGESLAVKCNIASYPQPHTIEWFKVGDSFYRQNGDTLRLDSVSADDAGKFICKASITARPSGTSMQKEHTDNATVILHVRHKPGETVIQPSSLEAVAGKPFTLLCAANPPGYPKPEYRWWREGQEKVELSRQSNYTLISAHVSHEGQYYCQTQNSLGYGTIASSYLTVYEPASITIPLRPQFIRKEGDINFSITCRARGKPKPQVQWLHNGKAIPSDSSFFKVMTTSTLEDSNVNSVQSTLTFEGHERKSGKLTALDRGKFSCIYDNGFGDTASEMVLKVEHSPIVKHTYNRVAFDVRETAILKCIMQAYPEPVFEWYHYSRALDNYGNYGINISDIGSDTYVGVLSIKDITEGDYGEYTCRARNQIGGDKKTIIKLVKKGVPEKPSNIELVDVSSDKMTLRWVPGFNGGFSNTEYIITYLPVGGEKARNESCRSQNICEIVGLQSEAEYKLKILAVNPRGHSQYSDEITVKTKPSLRDMPRALDAHYDKESSQLTFTVESFPMPLLAKVQARYEDSNEWITQMFIQINGAEELVYLQPGAMGFSDVRVLLCLQNNDSWCGDPRLASPFDDSPRTVETGESFNIRNTVLITGISCSVLFVVFFIFCICWCRKGSRGKKQQEIKSLSASNPQPVVALPYYSEENLTKHGDVLDGSGKPNIYLSPMSDNTNEHICPGSPDHRLLYQSDRDMNGCLVPDSHMNMLMKSGDLPSDGSYYPFEGEMVNEYYHGNEYKQVNEDIMNMKNREHLRSPYYDVSGLPDPYSMRDEEKMHHNSMCFDESLESGYSTPNSRSRRIIREIIV